MAEGGIVVDHHSSDFFPERFFDLVVVLQTDNSHLYDRLHKRGYAEAKIRENIECEIMQVRAPAQRCLAVGMLRACTVECARVRAKQYFVV